MSDSRKTPEQKAEVKQIRNIAKDFGDLIDMKQAEYNEYGIDYTPEDLLKGTKYEGRIEILGNLIEFHTAHDIYLWLYTPRHGNQPARLTEKFQNWRLKENA